MKFGLGQSAPRVEDQRLLTGAGRYTDDHNLAGQLYMHVVRSPYPHARIVAIDQRAALSSPGVVAVLEHADLLDDGIGTMMNPRLIVGQLQGGVVQGFGQIMMEQVVYGDDGQQLSGSFMDYCMPRADEVPFCNVQFNPVPTKTNPLGIKGVGEAGTVGSMPAVMSALLDALRPVGVTDLHMPASPHRVWQAIRAARIETDSAQSAG